MIPKRWNPVFRSDFSARQHPYGGDPHRGSALNSGALVGTFYADRSKPGGLAIRCCIGNSRFCRDPCRRHAVVRAPLDGRHAINLAVRRALRVLDLLPPPRAVVAKNDLAAECADHDGHTAVDRARRSRGAAAAKKSGHGHYAAQSGHRCHAASRTANAFSAGHARNATRCSGPLALQAAVIGVFS